MKITRFVFFEGGKFCWRKEVRDKTASDYKQDARELRLILTALIIYLIFFG